MMSWQRNYLRGYFIRAFTLIELLITILLAFILLMFAVPNASALLLRHQISSDLQHIVRVLEFARNQAINQGVTVTVCATINGQRCQGDDWTNILIFSDRNGNHQLDKDDVLLAVSDALSQGAHLSWLGFVANNYLQFAPTVSVAASAGHFNYCLQRGDRKILRRIVLSRSGRVRIA